MKRILSIDGGGIRGAASATFLKHLEEKLDKSLYDTFDMFAGTSTGGLIALGISALKYSGEDVENYKLLNP